MRRIVVSLLKGGVAKSETAVSLAHGLARQGFKVLLVDTDVQAQCNDMLGVEPDKGLAELIAGWASPEEALVEARENLWLLAGGVPLAGVKMEIARREMAPEAVLEETLACYDNRFDIMVMDTAPGWDTLLVNALYCCREVLSPVSMEPVALKGLRRFEERLGVIQKYQPALALKWIVPTFVDGRVKKTAHIMEQLQAEFSERLTAPIHYSVKLSEAPEFGKTIFEHDPRGAGARGYRALVERVLRDAPAGEALWSLPGQAIKLPVPAPPVEAVLPPEKPEEPATAAALEEARAEEIAPVATPPEPPRQEPMVQTPAWQAPDPPAPMPDPMATPPVANLAAPEQPALQEAAPPAAPETPAWPPRSSQATFASQVERLLQEQTPPARWAPWEQTTPQAAPPDTASTGPLSNRLGRRSLAVEPEAAPRPKTKVWDLRERLRKVPVLSQRLTKGLGSR